MKITRIERQKNDDTRYSIYIDNEFSFGIDEIDLVNFKIVEGNEITLQQYNYIIDNVILKKAKNKAFKYLEYKDRTEKEIYNKLKAYDYQDDIIFKVINFLKEYKYIDDNKYARNFLKNRFNIKGYGIKHIIYELKQKGISEDIILDITNDINCDEKQKAIEIIKKKLKQNDISDVKVKQKIYNFLLRRGFSYNIINSAFNEFLD